MENKGKSCNTIWKQLHNTYVACQYLRVAINTSLYMMQCNGQHVYYSMRQCLYWNLTTLASQ